jgi:hypothetical protein
LIQKKIQVYFNILLEKMTINNVSKIKKFNEIYNIIKKLFKNLNFNQKTILIENIVEISFIYYKYELNVQNPNYENVKFLNIRAHLVVDQLNNLKESIPKEKTIELTEEKEEKTDELGEGNLEEGEEEKTSEEGENPNEPGEEEKNSEEGKEEKNSEEKEGEDETEEKTSEKEGNLEEEKETSEDEEEEKETSEDEEEETDEGEGEKENFDEYLSGIFDEPDLEEEKENFDEYLSGIFDELDLEGETGKLDEYLLSIFDDPEPVLKESESPVIFDDPGDNFTSTVFDDTFPKEPTGFKKKIIKPKITEDEKIKNMSETMKKFFEYRRKQKIRELLKNKILREIEGSYDDPKKIKLLTTLNRVIKKDHDTMINKINKLNPQERNIFNEEIKNYFEEIEFTAEIDKDTNNLIDEFESNEPDNNSFEYINNKFNNFGLVLKPKLIKSKIRETYDISNDKISQIMKMIIELEKIRKLDNLYKMKIKKLTDENLNIEEIEKYKNKKKNLDILYLNFPDNINKKIDELTDEEKKILEEEIKKYLLDDLINNEIDEDTNNLIDEFESNEPDDNFFEYIKTKFPEKQFNVRPKPINSKIRESHEILNDKISQIMKMIIELEKTRKINNLYDRKIKKITSPLGDIQTKTSTLNPSNENVEVMRNKLKELTQKSNQYKTKQKYIIEKINALSQKLNIKIDELTDEEKKILEEEIRKYLSLEEYSMSDYLYDKYKEITENIKKWIELTGSSIRNQIELNDWMKKLKNLKEENETTQTDENLKIMEEIKKITDTLKDGIKESKTKIGNLISRMTEKEKNNIEIMEEDINKKKMDDMKNRYMNALRLVKNIESEILSLSS